MEILLILGIVVLVFGVGKVKNIGMALGRSGKEFKKALVADDAEKETSDDDEPIDITPESPAKDTSNGPKPGTREQPIDEAEIVED
jgi:sec-independent protein translocase protein TatA